MFVKAGTYAKRLDTQRIKRRADLDNYLAKRLVYRIRRAVEPAQVTYQHDHHPAHPAVPEQSQFAAHAVF